MHNLMTVRMSLTHDQPHLVLKDIKSKLDEYITIALDEDGECVVVTVSNVSDVQIYSPDD